MKIALLTLATLFVLLSFTYVTTNVTKITGVTERTEEVDGSTPKAVTASFVQAMAAGDCRYAMRLTTGEATELVQGTIDAGCAPYRTAIKSVVCGEEGPTAVCTCVEERDEMEMKFNYSLRKEGKSWKITNYEKDFEVEE